MAYFSRSINNNNIYDAQQRKLLMFIFIFNLIRFIIGAMILMILCLLLNVLGAIFFVALVLLYFYIFEKDKAS